jgi:peptide chain release factor 1
MAEAYLIDKLNSVEQTFQELTRRMADPDVAQDPDEFQRIAKTRSSLEETVMTYHQWKEAVDELKGAKEVHKGAQSDPEMREMAALEVEELEQTIERLENRLKILLLPKDPNDEKSIMLEVRAGTGGDEASIWAGDLVRMYSRYAEGQGWRVKLLSESTADMGGFKEAILEIIGDRFIASSSLKRASTGSSGCR